MNSITQAIIKQYEEIKNREATPDEIDRIIAVQNKREDDKNMYGDTNN
jgi:hypothetical protein